MGLMARRGRLVPLLERSVGGGCLLLVVRIAVVAVVARAVMVVTVVLAMRRRRGRVGVIGVLAGAAEVARPRVVARAGYAFWEGLGQTHGMRREGWEAGCVCGGGGEREVGVRERKRGGKEGLRGGGGRGKVADFKVAKTSHPSRGGASQPWPRRCQSRPPRACRGAHS